MKAYNENNGNGQHTHNQYAAQRELDGHLTVLSGLIGNPHWQPLHGYDRSRNEAAVRRAHLLRSRAFTSTLWHGLHGMSGLIRKMAAGVSEYRLFRQNLAELNALDDRTLQDIGIFRGDIAAIAAKEITVNQINLHRETLARPRLKLVTEGPVKSIDEVTLPRSMNDLSNEAA